jgi:phosphodiesterase/alkaline phosphatase D-like protein
MNRSKFFSGISTLMCRLGIALIFANIFPHQVYSQGKGTPPTATSLPATQVGTKTATMNGKVIPGLPNCPGLCIVPVYFDYGLTNSYGNTINAQPPSFSPGPQEWSVTANLIGLMPNTQYHFRVRAESYAGTGKGSDQTFMTNPSEPMAEANTATSIGTTTATLNGTVNPYGLNTTVKFEYGIATSYDNFFIASPSPISGYTQVPVSGTIINLSPGATYNYRVVATNSAGITYSLPRSLTTLGAAPLVTTNAATNINSTSVKLNGTINPNGLSTNVKFQYGTTASYGSEVEATPSPVTGTSVVLVSANLTELAPGKTYHYRVVGTNSTGTTDGADQSFTTDTAGPTVATDTATNVNSNSATLNGTVNPNGLSTTVKFEFGASISYTDTITAMPSPITGTNQTSATATIKNLSPGTRYYYRIVAANSKGIINGTVQSFKTFSVIPVVTTNTATTVSATSATLNGAVNANGGSITVKFQYGTTTNYGSEVVATPSPVNGTSLVSVSAVLNTLSPGAIYHYRIVAFNSDTTIYGANQTFITIGALPNANTAGATKIDSTFAVLNGTVNPNGLRTDVTFAYGTTINYGDTVTTTQSPVNGTSPVSVSVLITNLSPGMTYNFHVIATNSLGKATGLDQSFITYSSTFKLNMPPLSFPDRPRASDYQAADYRMLGLPGASDQSVKKFLSGKQDKDWQVYWDNGNSFIEFRDGLEFIFSAGRAFWIIKKGSLNIDNITVPSAQLKNAVREVEIPLPHLGWNLITNPFPLSIAWSKVQSYNDNITEPIYSYNGSYSKPSSFDPYVGYYFFKDERNPRSSLKIPYALLFSGSSATEYVDPAKWRVNITLSSGDFVEKITSFGVATEANAGLDQLDFRKPPAIAVTPTVSFHRLNWDANYSIFATDIRPEFDDSESWEFDVRATSRQPAQLAFTGIQRIPAHFEVYLIDEGRAQSANLREDSLYRFTPAAELAKFKVVVGKKEKVQEQISSLTLPQEFALGHNYPNPFNPTTTIPVAIPAASEIKLQVYNLLGAEVKTIYDGSIEAGRYWFNWDGRNELGNQVATGVYLYRLTTNKGVVLVDKMILLR